MSSPVAVAMTVTVTVTVTAAVHQLLVHLASRPRQGQVEERTAASSPAASCPDCQCLCNSCLMSHSAARRLVVTASPHQCSFSRSRASHTQVAHAPSPAPALALWHTGTSIMSAAQLRCFSPRRRRPLAERPAPPAMRESSRCVLLLPAP